MSIGSQDELFRCMAVVLTSRSEDKAVSGLTSIHNLTKSGEIRDFDWCLDDDTNIYLVILKTLLLASHSVGGSGHEGSRENLSLLLYARLRALPEWNLHQAFNQQDVDYYHLIGRVFDRISSLAIIPSGKDQDDVLSPMRTIRIYQTLALDIYHYCHSVDHLRGKVRQLLVKHVLMTYSHKSTSPAALDAGNSRDHVQHLLPILLSVIRGFKVLEVSAKKFALLQQWEDMHPHPHASAAAVSLHDETIYEDEEFEERGDKEEGKEAHHPHRQPVDIDLQIAKIRKDLLQDVLMFLHTPNEMVLWRDQIPILQSYHEPLVQCVVALAKTVVVTPNQTKFFLVDAIRQLLQLWPEGFNTNTPKQVLLLHELEMLLQQCELHEFEGLQVKVLERLATCVGTNADNIRPAQRALEFFKKDGIVALLIPAATGSGKRGREAKEAKDHSDSDAEDEDKKLRVSKVSLRLLLPALFRGGVLSWNPTVNKMTALALKVLRQRNEVLFSAACNDYLGGLTSEDVEEKYSASNTSSSKQLSVPMDVDHASADSKAMPPPSSLPRGKIPKANSKFSTTLPPDSKVTDFNANRVIRNYADLKSSDGGSGGKQPPVTVTGVAPWAMNKAASSSAEPPSAKQLPPSFAAGNNMLPRPPSNNTPASFPHHDVSSIAELSTEKEEEGIERVLDYMKRCYAEVFHNEDEDAQHGKLEDYVYASIAERPLQLTDLKFHDLVFGQDLGQGAFSIVRYARHITKGKAQSQWPEYAVKMITPTAISSANGSNTETTSTNYIPSIIREISILHILQHPNICRMVSAFRYHQNAYVVLEYTQLGDLHSFLVNQGKLSHRHDLLRYILAEITVAIASIHDMGFVYNDLKPENVLITQLGHIKITDFGACRPMTTSATQLLKQHCQKVIDMRNGHWKAELEDQSLESEKASNEWKAALSSYQDHSLVEDNCEGTPGYMPPEAFRKRADRSIALVSRGDQVQADSWALGCIAYFCMHGKPRFFGEPNQVLQQFEEWFDEVAVKSHPHAHVSFHGDEVHDAHTTIGQKREELEDIACDDFIMKLLVQDPAGRLSISHALDHPYLTLGYFPSPAAMHFAPHHAHPAYNPRSIHNTPPPKWPEFNNVVASGQNDKWARRQFSTLWAPMPQDYNLAADTTGHATNAAAAMLLKTHNVDDGLFQIFRNPLPCLAEDSEQDSTLPFITLP